MTTANPSTATLQANFSNLYADIFWYGVLAGSSLAFLSIYAARLGASPLEIGLLTAGPALINLSLSLPSGRWLEGRPLVGTTYWTAQLHRLAYPILVFLPWAFSSTLQVQALIALTLLMSIPGTLLSIGFNAMFAELVPPEWRSRVVGRRNALVAVSLSLTSVLCGYLLDRLPFPGNYQALFAIGAASALLSSYHLGRLRPINGAREGSGRGLPLHDAARPGLLRFMDAVRGGPLLRFLARSSGRPLLRWDLVRGPYGSFLAAYLLFHTFQYIPIPLFSLHFVQDLALTDGQISIGNALFYLTMMLVSLQLHRLSARFSHHRLLALGAGLYGLYPALNAFARGPGLYWLAAVQGGAVWAMLNGALINRLMERVPEDDRPAHMALYNLALNLGILAGSLIGPLLSETLGLRQTLWFSAGLRLLGGVLVVIWG